MMVKFLFSTHVRTHESFPSPTAEVLTMDADPDHLEELAKEKLTQNGW